jgi:hypothetical protein
MTMSVSDPEDNQSEPDVIIVGERSVAQAGPTMNEKGQASAIQTRPSPAVAEHPTHVSEAPLLHRVPTTLHVDLENMASVLASMVSHGISTQFHNFHNKNSTAYQPHSYEPLIGIPLELRLLHQRNLLF